ncbi:hypothetical protein HY415_00670 [Candidatus Kaiserbacteria bacterium]|nr:hypothetical protein [Candidatus Kaiserbacteria bacterium]
MHNELTNLLPLERQGAFLRNYFLRLSVIFALLVSALVFISAVLLLPTYVFLAKSAGTKEAHLTNIESALSSADEKELSARLTALTRDAAALNALADVPSASGIFRTVLAVPRPGITLSGFAYAPAGDKAPRVLTFSGVAATRDALRSYQLALQGAPFALSATLPVSAYAKDTDIAFAITVTLAP